MRKKTYYYLWLFMVIPLVSCQSTDGLFPTQTNFVAQDTNLKLLLLGMEECNPPCWKGIIPLETSYEAALDEIKELVFFTPEGYLDKNDEKGLIDWYGGDGNSVHIRLYERTVSFIYFTLIDTNLGSIVSHFGDPSAYFTYEDDESYSIALLYPKVGLVFHAGHPSSLKISETMSVELAYFMNPSEITSFAEEYLRMRRVIYPLINNFDMEYFTWEGYGVCPKGLMSNYLCQE